eukprot:874196-Pleurochrysis_carterae.AAC.1
MLGPSAGSSACLLACSWTLWWAKRLVLPLLSCAAAPCAADSRRRSRRPLLRQSWPSSSCPPSWPPRP